jgi:hypothetical protein
MRAPLMSSALPILSPFFSRPNRRTHVAGLCSSATGTLPFFVENAASLLSIEKIDYPPPYVMYTSQGIGRTAMKDKLRVAKDTCARQMSILAHEPIAGLGADFPVYGEE